MGRIGMKRNIAYGLIFFLIVAIVYGLSLLLTLAASPSPDDLSTGATLMVQLSSMFAAIPLTTTAVTLIVGIFQGKLAKNKKEAAITGGITGGIGSLIMIILIVGIGLLAFFLKLGQPTGGAEQDVNLVRTFLQFLVPFIPAALLGALSAFLSIRFIFPIEKERGLQSKIIPTEKPSKATPSGSTQRQIEKPWEKKKTVYVCPQCSAFVTSGETTCHRCGTSLRWP